MKPNKLNFCPSIRYSLPEVIVNGEEDLVKPLIEGIDLEGDEDKLND